MLITHQLFVLYLHPFYHMESTISSLSAMWTPVVPRTHIVFALTPTRGPKARRTVPRVAKIMRARQRMLQLLPALSARSRTMRPPRPPRPPQEVSAFKQHHLIISSSSLPPSILPRLCILYLSLLGLLLIFLLLLTHLPAPFNIFLFQIAISLLFLINIILFLIFITLICSW